MSGKFTWRFIAGLVSILAWAAGAAAQNSVAIAPDPSGKFGKFAYVSNYRSNTITMYTIDHATGALTSIGTIDAGIGPASVAVDPSGKFAYVANETGNVSMYTIDATTGALTSIGSPVATGDLVSESVAVDPTGKFAYVANEGDPCASDATFTGSVTMYTIDAVTGALRSAGMILAPCAPPPSPGSCAPHSVAVHPSGKFAYVANEGGFAPTSVSMYSINATIGTLAFTGVIASGGRALSVAVDPTGKFAYVVDGSLKGNVSMYIINTTTGALTLIGIIDAGSFPTSIAIDPSGKFAYVTNSGSNDVSMYRIDGPTGALTLIGIIDAGSSPTSIAIDPSGKFAYVTNSGSNDVSRYRIDTATGALRHLISQMPLPVSRRPRR